jgi:TfoX/Sxy family transcriptional regulator of competence genes
MPKSLRSAESFRQFVLDQLESLDVTSRSMFGGTGLYARGVFFGIIAIDRLYLKVDDTNRAMFERKGMKPFKPYAHRPVTMKYYEVPVSVLESAPELERWARLSIAAAERAADETAAAQRTRGARASTRATRRTSTARAAHDRTRR